MMSVKIWLNLLAVLGISVADIAVALATSKGNRKTGDHRKVVAKVPHKDIKEESLKKGPMSDEEIKAFLKDNIYYQEGVRAMVRQLPGVAVTAFKELLSQTKPPLPKEVSVYVERDLGEAYVRQGDYTQAVDILSKHPEVLSSNEGLFWWATAKKGLGFYSDAIKIFVGLSDDVRVDPSIRESSKWQLAYSYLQINDINQGLAVLENLAQKSDSKNTEDTQAKKGQTVLEKQAHLALAGVLINLNRPEDALVHLEALSLSPKTGNLSVGNGIGLILKARAYVMLKKSQEAFAVLKEVLNDKTLSSELRGVAQVLSAHAEMLMEQEEKASGASYEGTGQDHLLAFIDAEPDSSVLSDAFSLLYTKGAFKEASVRKKLEDWSQGGAKNRTQMAMLTMVRVLRDEEADVALLDLVKRSWTSYPKDLISAELTCEAIQYFTEKGKWNEVKELLAYLPQGSGEKKFLEGGVSYALGDYVQAEEVYHKALGEFETVGTFLDHGDLEGAAKKSQEGRAYYAERKKELEQYSMLNRGLAILREQMPLDEQNWQQLGASENTIERLSLERGLEAASRVAPEAKGLLENFLAHYKNHARRDEALMALSELVLYQAEGTKEEKIKASQLYLAQLEQESLSPQLQERLLRLKIVVAEFSEQWAQAIKEVKTYLDVYPNSSQVLLMKLKLGELIYRHQDYNQAQLYLRNLAKNLPESSPSKVTALFLAGKAAQQLNTQQGLETALELFGEVRKHSHSPYYTPSVIEMASILMRWGQAQKVIDMLSEFTGSSEVTGEARRLGRAIEAETWGSLVTPENKAPLAKVKELTELILKEPDLPMGWKHRTLFQKARLQERTGDKVGAMKSYDKIMQDIPSSPLGKEWYWYYQAGFAAMHLLEEDHLWNAAMVLGMDMYKSGGPRAEEARSRAKKIQLENFVWGDDIFEKPEEAEIIEEAPSVLDEVEDKLES